MDAQSLGIGGIAVAMVAAVAGYIKDHRKVKADADRDEAMLPLDLVHQATAIAKDQLSSMAAELDRLRDRLMAAETENDRLRTTLAETRAALDLAHGHLRDAWRKLNEVHPEAGMPPWVDDI